MGIFYQDWSNVKVMTLDMSKAMTQIKTGLKEGLSSIVSCRGGISLKKQLMHESGRKKFWGKIVVKPLWGVPVTTRFVNANENLLLPLSS